MRETSPIKREDNVVILNPVTKQARAGNSTPMDTQAAQKEGALLYSVFPKLFITAKPNTTIGKARPRSLRSSYAQCYKLHVLQ